MVTLFRPLADRVLLEAIEEEDVTATGIILPETAKEKPQQGMILATGPGRLLDNGERVPIEVKVGDRVIFSKYAGTEVKVEDKTLLILAEKDILAIVEEEEEKEE